MEDTSKPIYLSLTELTEAAIKRETETLSNLGVLGRANMTDAIRNNLGAWEKSLFPLLRSRGIGAYQYIANLLIEAGYKDVTANHVCTAINRIRRAKKPKNAINI